MLAFLLKITVVCECWCFSLNNTYFIGSVYAGMLWSLGDVTEPFHVNFFNVQKKNLYSLDYFYAGFETKHECRGRERDQIRYISVGAGRRGTESCGSGTEKSIPRRSLPLGTHVETKRKADRDLIAFAYQEDIEPQTDPQTNRTQTTSGGGLSTVRFWVLLGGSEITWFVHIYTLNRSGSVWKG